MAAWFYAQFSDYTIVLFILLPTVEINILLLLLLLLHPTSCISFSDAFNELVRWLALNHRVLNVTFDMAMASTMLDLFEVSSFESLAPFS